MTEDNKPKRKAVTAVLRADVSQYIAAIKAARRRKS